ncbi:DCC1 [Diplonema papillatum]|nr:DCC1 [Diplonema papillatum]
MKPKKIQDVECDIVFAPSAKLGRYKMVHGDTDAMALLESLKGREVVVKGSLDDERAGESVVLCTTDRTFDVVVLETTNTCLLCRRQDGADKVVEGMFDHTQLLRAVPAKVDKKLDTILQRSSHPSHAPSSAPQPDQIEAVDLLEPAAKKAKKPPSQGTALYTTDQIIPQIRASKKEVLQALSKSPAALVDGTWRLSPKADVESALESLIRLGDSAMDLRSFTSEEAAVVLEPYHDPVAIACCIKAYCTEIQTDSAGGEGSKSNGQASVADTRLRVCPHKVAVSRAEQLFSVNESWPVKLFYEEWASMCPAFATPEPAMLLGIALVLDGGKTISYFPSKSLPLEPGDRFDAMFAKTKRWTKEDMTAFIEPITGTGQTLLQLLQRYTREFPVDGAPTYVPFSTC